MTAGKERLSRYICVTGAAGFIGRALSRKLCERGDRVYAVDRLDYAAEPASMERLATEYPEHFHLRPVDIRSLGRLPDVDAVIHLAASTHVDNSLNEGEEFVANNVGSTAKLLELIRAKGQHGFPHLVHISTDEVYGSIETGKASAESPLAPSSPYAASKAAADLLVRAWGTTFGLPYTVIRPTNVYGSGQHPEKLIPKCVRSIMLDREIPVHGDGSMTRQWLWVDDLCDAIMLVLDKPKELPRVVNVSGNTEAAVGEIAARICFLMKPEANAYTMIKTGYQRPAVDARYSVDDSEIRLAGWRPTGDFWNDLPELVEQERTRFRF